MSRADALSEFMRSTGVDPTTDAICLLLRDLLAIYRWAGAARRYAAWVRPLAKAPPIPDPGEGSLFGGLLSEVVDRLRACVRVLLEFEAALVKAEMLYPEKKTGTKVNEMEWVLAVWAHHLWDREPKRRALSVRELWLLALVFEVDDVGPSRSWRTAWKRRRAKANKANIHPTPPDLQEALRRFSEAVEETR